MDTTKEFRYRELAVKIGKYIQQNQLKSGDKIPSVRKMSKDFNVSIATVLMAYDLLIDKGIIISRQRYGYFVNETIKRILEPDKSDFQMLPANVSMNEMASKMMINAKKFSLANFSILSPSPEMLPINQLNKCINKALAAPGNNAYDYPLIEGHDQLTWQITKNSMHWHNALKNDEVIVTNGALEAINLCLSALTVPGDTVIVESPTYAGLLQAIENHHLKVVEVPCSPETGIDLSLIEKSFRSQKITACILQPTLNNPLGCSMPDTHKKILIDLITQYQVPVIEDDTLGELLFDQEPHQPLKAFDKEGYVLYCNSFSKTLAPGFRIGWVSGGQYHHLLRRHKYGTNIASSAVMQDALSIYLATGKYRSHLNKLKIELQKNVFLYLNSIHKHFPASIQIAKVRGGLSLWVRLADHIDAMELQRVALEDKIGICPGKIFSNNNYYNNYIRINFGPVWSKRIDQHLKVLGSLIKASS